MTTLLIFIIVCLFIAGIILLVALRLQVNENERLKEEIKILNKLNAVKIEQLDLVIEIINALVRPSSL